LLRSLVVHVGLRKDNDPRKPRYRETRGGRESATNAKERKEEKDGKESEGEREHLRGAREREKRTLSLSAPASMRSTAVDPWPDSKAKWRGVLPA